MSLARKAVRGAIWTIASSVGARIVGVVGTLVMTRFLAPEIIGEVMAASILAFTADLATNLGLGNFVVVKAKERRDIVFQVTFYQQTTGVLAFAVVFFLGDRLGPIFNAPNVGDYLPGMVLAAYIRRLHFVPMAVLAAQMRFRTVAAANGIGEVAYTAVAVGLAYRGFGGESIVIGNIVQGAVMTIICAASVNWREWLEPHPVRWETTREIFTFGLPISGAAIAGYMSRYWDNLLFSRYFGVGPMGLYNMAYNLADIPATHVGEHIGDVLLPSMGQLAEHDRKIALVRSSGLLALLVFPLAVGLACVSDSLVRFILNEQWQGVAPLLMVLSIVSVVRPLGVVIATYLTAGDRTRVRMYLEVARVFMLAGCIVAFARFGPRWACAAVGLAYTLSTISSIWVVVRLDHVRWQDFASGFFRPLLACVPMAGAVYGTRWLIAHSPLDYGAVSLVAEILVGAIVYVPSAFIFAPAIARDFVGLLKNAVRRGDDERTPEHAGA